jgi:hypothetical protein
MNEALLNFIEEQAKKFPENYWKLLPVVLLQKQ